MGPMHTTDIADQRTAEAPSRSIPSLTAFQRVYERVIFMALLGGHLTMAQWNKLREQSREPGAI
jgi:hypothetical protein